MDDDVQRQLRQAGLPADEAGELADLAAEVERLPAVKPRRAWLHESKWRLLRAFDEQRAGADADAAEPED